MMSLIFAHQRACVELKFTGRFTNVGVAASWAFSNFGTPVMKKLRPTASTVRPKRGLQKINIEDSYLFRATGPVKFGTMEHLGLRLSDGPVEEDDSEEDDSVEDDDQAGPTIQ